MYFALSITSDSEPSREISEPQSPTIAEPEPYCPPLESQEAMVSTTVTSG